jgi:hypothetical protein
MPTIEQLALAPAETDPAGADVVRITKPEHVGGHWRANASIAGQTRTFHNRFGTWQTDRRRSDDWPPRAIRREALPAIARALTHKIRRLERRQERQA